MEVLRKAILEGIVLLENDGTLPLIKGEKIALFGRASYEYVKSGMGSGGRVRTSYQTDIKTELKKVVVVDKTVDDYYLDFVKNNPLERRDDIWNFIPTPTHPVLDGRTTNITVQGTNGKVGKIKFAFYTEKDENNIVVLPQITALKIKFFKD